ncbi:MAG: thioredoxin family protein [Armatimonadota bacterium]|nr:thioredoxin family protein [Armatimonadota bacterium]MDR5703342.1 thioredoxin family protein [Armatimonadota bacterium]MDR7433524.1 thioredoxin family protein [Armatimonadota bacterium]
MKIQVVGPGCPRCQATERNVLDACYTLQLPAEVEHVHDPKEFAKLGVRFTPAVIVDGRILISGRVPSVAELQKLFTELQKASGESERGEAHPRT